MVPVAYGAGLAAGKAGMALKALMGSKYFLHLLLGAGYLGGKGITAAEQAGERGLTREQMRLQELMQKASAEATERGYKESRAKAKEYTEALLKMRKEEMRESRDIAAMQAFTESQNQQMALVLQAVQAIGQRQPGRGGAGVLGLLRGGF
uniref:Uncharacterized protein n=1 Tax=viral metagenome TaxID=1070528 RepID=A0A6M3J8U2_9ZZZZ